MNGMLIMHALHAAEDPRGDAQGQHSSFACECPHPASGPETGLMLKSVHRAIRT